METIPIVKQTTIDDHHNHLRVLKKKQMDKPVSMIWFQASRIQDQADQLGPYSTN